VHDEGLVRLRAADRDRPDERVACVDRRIAWDELLAGFEKPTESPEAIVRMGARSREK